jgi:regulator of protease activity HflC (stomatin/prohibitin superfamily)
MGIIASLIISLVAFLMVLLRVDVTGGRYSRIARGIALTIGILAVIATILQAVSRCLIVIPAGTVGVRELFGKVNNRPLTPGVYFVNPLGDVVKFSTRLQDLKETITTTSNEGLTLDMDVSLQYRLDPQQADEIYQNIGEDASEIITSRFRSIVRETTASYQASAVYGEKRQEVAQKMHAALQAQMEPLGFVVEEALLRNVILPENLRQSIEEKLAAEQESQKAQFELGKARQAAEKLRIEAKGQADAQRLLAEGLTEELLRLKAIEATSELARSENTKVVVIGNGEARIPLVLQGSP